MAAPRITVEETPNPHALKLIASQTINPGPTRSYRDPDQAGHDPLAAELFAAGPVVSVMVVRDFVTVNKKPSARWKTLRPKLEAVLQRHLDGPEGKPDGDNR